MEANVAALVAAADQPSITSPVPWSLVCSCSSNGQEEPFSDISWLPWPTKLPTPPQSNTALMTLPNMHVISIQLKRSPSLHWTVGCCSCQQDPEAVMNDAKLQNYSYN